MKSTLRHIFPLLLAILSALGSQLSAFAERPQLVIGIVADQLQTDYLQDLLPLMGQGGFNRLFKQGMVITDLDFGVPSTDAASAVAEIYTGAWPSQTGVTGRHQFDRRTRRLVPALLDGNTYTPTQLRLSTITDELVIDGQRFGKVYSLAADPQVAVLMGGHEPASAAWIDPNTGQWATAPYYTGALPAPLAMRNLRRPLRARLDTMLWKPLLDVSRYPGLPPQKKYYPFSHGFRSTDRDVFSRFALTPMGNREVTDAALQYITELKPGHGKGTIDMLNVGYSLAPYTQTKDGDYRLELMDAYLRLDRDLERLLNTVDREVGLDKTVVFLVSTGHFDNDARPSDTYRIPGGEFSTKRAAALLNSFLGARYGSADYVAGIAGTHVYLNEKALSAITSRQSLSSQPSALSSTPLQEARDFLCRMDGIAAVQTVSDILSGTTDALEEASRALDPRTAGDLIINVQPGWTLVDDYATPVTRTAMRRSTPATPAVILSPTLTPTTITDPVSALRLAPTLSRLLRLPAPDGAAARSLPLPRRQ